LALCGDSADNIPGVKGIGEKGAKTLLDEYGSIEGIYSNLSMIRNERTKNMLAAGRENAELSKRLATLYNGLDTPNIETAEFPSENPLLRVVDILEDYSLSRLVGTLGLAQKPLKFESNLILKEEELERLVESVDENTLVAFDTETTGLDAKTSPLLVLVFVLTVRALITCRSRTIIWARRRK
jgi:DNA polymerase-1